MGVLNELAYWADIIAIIVVTLAVIFLGVVIYMKKYMKPKREEEKDEQYSTFERKDAKSYLPMDDVRDDMIICNDETRFVGAVICKGVDFFSSHYQEQLTIKENYIGFINSISNNVQLRMTTKAVDLERTIARHEKAKNNYAGNLKEVYEDLENLIISMKQEESEEMLNQYRVGYADLKRKRETLEWKMEHIDHVIHYLREVSSTQVAPIRESVYLFDWTFNPMEFPEGISKEQIFERANSELETLAEQYRHALASCGVRAKRANTAELQEMIRRHMKPYGANIFKRSALEGSNADEIIVTSDVLEEARVKLSEAYDQEFKDRFEKEINGILSERGIE